jgi:hypothetical protein
MNNPFLNPEDIISGTESAYIINEPLPVLNLYDRLKSDHKLALNKNVERWTSASTIKSKLKDTLHYEDLSIGDLKLLYAMTNQWFHESSNSDIVFGENMFEK